MIEEKLKKEIDFSDSIYIGACKTCKDDVYSRSRQNYIVYYYKNKAHVFCSLYCFTNFIGKL